jgi:hypothetical protein
MVDEVDSKICEWHEDGKSFIIKDQKAFEKVIIPQFFKHSKIASFVRVSSGGADDRKGIEAKYFARVVVAPRSHERSYILSLISSNSISIPFEKFRTMRACASIQSSRRRQRTGGAFDTTAFSATSRLCCSALSAHPIQASYHLRGAAPLNLESLLVVLLR